MQPRSAPGPQTSLRRYSTVSNVVPVPQVWIVAVPDTAGVHSSTCSGDPLPPQLPPRRPPPAVVPTNVPPPAGIVPVGAHASRKLAMYVVLPGSVAMPCV